MTESEAVVVGIDGDHAVLELTGPGSCGGCEKVAGCGLGDGRMQRRQRVRNDVGARIGDTVILRVPDGAVLKAALRAYIWPLLLILIGVASGLTFGGDPFAAVGGLAGLVAGWIVLRTASHSGAREPLLTMRVKHAVVQLHRTQMS